MEEKCTILLARREWKQLLKAIVVYITCEGRYNRAMIYHFKLMNHFIGKIPLNLPFYLHRSLEKMAHQVKAQPTKLLAYYLIMVLSNS